MKNKLRFWSPLFKPLLVATLAFAFSLQSRAQLSPVLIFKDTFNSSVQSNDINFENTARQTGSAAPLTYSENAGSDEQTQINADDAPGHLRISNAYVSPNHNFTEGGQFTVEFDINPGIDDADSTSTDWAAIVFGATAQNRFVNGSDGMGILFRNNGGIEVWDGGSRVSGGGGDFPGGLPTNSDFHVRIEVSTDNFRGGSPATIHMFVNNTEVHIGGGDTFSYTKASGFKGNYLTFEGIGAWTHLFDNISVASIPCLHVGTSFVDEVAGQTSQAITVTVPKQVNDTKAADLTVSSQNPAVAIPTGADASGQLKIHFTAGGPTSQTFTVKGLTTGSTVLSVSGDPGVCVDNSVRVHIANGNGLSEVVFSDTFNTSAADLDINFENDKRQTGTAGVLTYNEPAGNMAGGASDDSSQVNSDVAPGKLLLQAANGVIWASPNYNFLEGGNYKVEFDVNPSINDPDRTTDDWAAAVVGASTQGAGVNGSDGVGILFRSNGGIQAFDGGALVFDAPAGTLPTGELKIRVEVATPDFSGLYPAKISLFVNDAQINLSATDPSFTKPAGFRGNFITLEGYAAAANIWPYSFDNLKITSQASVHALAPANLTFALGDSPQTVTIKIPEQMVSATGAVVKLTSSNTGVATLQGATAGVLTLNFAKGGPLTQTVTINPVGKGHATFELSNTNGILSGPAITATVLSALVRNPSFEDSPAPGYPGYGPILNWTGGSGLNTSAGPFHDNGVIPDRKQIAFIQGSSVLSQTINGLQAGKQYWLQYRYNVRAGGSMDLTTRFDGVDLKTVTAIQLVGAGNAYYYENIPFTPANTNGLLEFASAATGDATVLLDAVTLVQRDLGNVVLKNPSFEASGEPPAPGIISPNLISGWTGTGTNGVNFSNAGAYADNGTNPDQDLVAFIRGAGSLSQNISGLVAGELYTVKYSYNAHSGNTPHLKVTVGDQTLQDEDVIAVGGNAAYRSKTVSFTAAGGSALLTFAQTIDADQTVLLDDVSVTGKSSTLACIKVDLAKLDLTLGQVGSLVTVTIPAELNATTAAQVTVTAMDPNVATVKGAVNGAVTLNFAAGALNTQSFEIVTVGKGNARFALSNKHGVCQDTDIVTAKVSGTFVKNPSFEDNPAGAYPGYGSIIGWTGGSGLNNQAGPFHDNGIIPDRDQIAFIQNSKSMTQVIGGLTAGKTYWVQFRYNVRNCCGGTMNLSVLFDGVEVGRFDGITPVGGSNPYAFANFQFTPTGTSGTLEFAADASGDATVLLDSVSLVQRDAGNIVVENPSFEAEGTIGFPGYLQPKRIAGWIGTGNYGVNTVGVGPFFDNGSNPEQDSAAFIQGDASLSQDISGLTAGQNYTVSYSYNARGGNAPHIKTTIGAVTLQDADVSPVGGTAPFTKGSFGFTADSDVMNLKFAQTAAGDNTLLLDNITVVPGGVEPGVTLKAQVGAGSTIRLSWPVAATGYKLQTLNTIGGTWADSALPSTVVGTENVITDSTSAATTRFYRLIK